MVAKRNVLKGFLAVLLLWTTGCGAQSIGYYRVGSDTIENRLRLYKGGDPERRMMLTRLFEEVGCKGDRLRLQEVANADAPNVICTLPGMTESVIVVGAHFDRVNTGQGVADNWSGASLLPSLYQSLRSGQRRHTYVFIGFTDEEKGYVGSKYFVEHKTEEELASTRAMIDLDTLGLDSTRVWASQSSPELVALLFEVADMNHLPLEVMNVDRFGNSDGSSFVKYGVPIITLHSVTLENIGILHSEKDRLSAIKLDAYYDTYKLIAAYLSWLDTRAGPRPVKESNRDSSGNVP